jgi:feruloyl-CoA synthase
MTDHLGLRAHSVKREDRGDGSLLLTSGYALGPVARVASDWLRDWSETAPTRVFIAERSGPGWREVTYSQAMDQVMHLAGALLERGLGPEAPLLILSGNSVDHALLSLAAHHVGIPTVPVAEQYSLIPGAHPRLKHVVDLVKPGAVFASDAESYGAAIDLCGVPAITSTGGRGTTAIAELKGNADVASAHAATGPDTVAKILMTSGSTSEPKGVETTQRMMTTNQTQIADSLPFLRARPPVLVDWLPWNHVFGGSHNFNMALANGGTLYIDDGKPPPALFPRTIENLGMVSGTISFNVPVGFAQLVTALRADADLRRTYFAELDMIFYAGASLPQDVWAALEEIALAEGRNLPLITSSWGLTETAPGATIQHEPAKGAGIVGVPMPGVTVKLVPDDAGRFDVRVKGPSIFAQYHRNPGKTDEAFDDEGFFLTGDAMTFVDAEDPSRGLKFEGRLSEDFKLTSGTWVQAANLRLEVLGLLAPFAADVIICGAGRDEVGALVVPNRAALDAAGVACSDDGTVLTGDIQAQIAAKLAPAADRTRGGAKRIACFAVMSEAPSMADGELTAKGNINFPKLLARRADLVERLFAKDDPASVSM